MTLKKITLSILLLSLLNDSNLLLAQSFQGLEAVKLFNAVDGDSLSLEHRAGGPLVAIIFTSNYCPYSRKYEDRIKALFQEFDSEDVRFLLVNPNDTPEDSPDEMRKKARDLGISVPYLKDHQQLLTGILGATRTPEAFLLKPVKNGFGLVYRGAIDDNPQTAMDVESDYLRTAITNQLQGKPIQEPEVRVTGCIIKEE